ncbi:hypothetical protein HGA89_03635 [bacterium]|nr:hypothetical protein [bacterium]
MSRPILRSVILPAAAAPWLALLLPPLLLVSCTGETGPDAALHEVGAVEGYALVAGRGEPVVILASLLTAGNYYDYTDAVVAETWSDSTGWYRLEVPAGRYILDTRGTAGGSTIRSRPDTVQVTPHVLRHDLRRGLARVRVRVPPAWEGRSCSLRLETDTRYDCSDGDRVEDGWADFEYHAVEPGSYLMEFSSPHGEEFFLPGSMTAAGADTLIVGLEAASSYEGDFTQTYATITGRVTGSWQLAPVQSLSVYAYATDSQQVSYDYCDPDGSFQIVLAIPQDVRLLFYCGGASRWHGGLTFATATNYALQAGDRITGIDVVEGGLEIWLDGPGVMAHHDVDLEVCDEAGNVLVSLDAWHSPIRIGNLLPGRVLLRLDGVCERQTWAGQWFDGAASPADATPIEVVAGERRRLDVTLTPGGSIAGVIREADGAIPGSIQMTICDDHGEPLCQQWSYFNGGDFSFVGLADGDFYLKALSGDGSPWWYPGASAFEGAVAVGITDHGAVTGLSWMLPSDEGGSRP